MADPTCVDDLMKSFSDYDATVDVVSAFEMLFTESDTGLPSTVAHFERFPAIPVDGKMLTPDFTVLFDDESALVGEVARIALHENSVEGLCRQLLRYDALTQIPASTGFAAVEIPDVLLLVPSDVGPEASRRIIDDRMANNDHWYDPHTAPTVMQFHFDTMKYVFQKLQLSLNGHPDDRERIEGLGSWLKIKESINVKPSRFRAIKAGRAFVNDAPDDLYLATLLWTKVVPLQEEHASGMKVISSRSLRDEVRRYFGRINISDIRRAMDVLARAKLAVALRDDTWAVAWFQLRGAHGDHDVARTIAQRWCEPPKGRGKAAQLVAASTLDTEAGTDMTLFSLMDD